jgi:NAD(P)-dependent dehydrogenase (short-subunit alcohol dehydrogenase family)
VSGPLEAAQLLRAGVLDGVLVLLAGAVPDDASDVRSAPDGSLARVVGEACAALGAQAIAWSPAAELPAAVDVLVVDGAAAFAAARAAGGQGGASDASRAALRSCLDVAWEASHTVANAAFIEQARPGRIVYLAPPAASGEADGGAGAEHADAACAGLENLARTLSIEWARHAITTVAIAPGASTRADDVAALCAYLASPAGAYFSGCLLDLRGPGA